MVANSQRKSFYKQLAAFVGVGVLAGILIASSPRQPVHLRPTSDLKRVEQLEKNSTTIQAKEFYHRYGVLLKRLEEQFPKITFDPLNPQNITFKVNDVRFGMLPVTVIKNPKMADNIYWINQKLRISTRGQIVERDVTIPEYDQYISKWQGAVNGQALNIALSKEIASVNGYFKQHQKEVLKGAKFNFPRPKTGALLGAIAGAGAFAAWRKRDKIKEKAKALKAKASRVFKKRTFRGR